MELSTYDCESIQRKIQCFVPWLLNVSQEIRNSGDSLNHFLITLTLPAFTFLVLTISSCLFAFTMFVTACCLFFWWKNKKSFPHKKSNNIIIKHGPSGKGLKTPVIRSEDLISFVLPMQNQHTVDAHRSKCLDDSTAIVNPGYRINSNCLDPSDLNLKLYSPGHETNENEHSKKAKIGVSFQYFPSRQLLIVKILGALNLPGRNEKTAPDPYVKISILQHPGRQIKCSTRTLRSNFNPLFNQVFEIHMTSLDISEAQILLQVRDRPESSRYERCMMRQVALGQALISLSEFNEISQRRQIVWCLLDDASLFTSETNFKYTEAYAKGEMLVSLRYEAEHGRMVLELKKLRITTLSYQEKDKVIVKVLLYGRGYLMSSRRTSGIRQDEATAVLQERFVFALQPSVLHEASCQFVLVTKSTIGTKRTLGRITLGHRHFFSTWAKSTAFTTGIDHWHDMAHRPGVAIERWHAFS